MTRSETNPGIAIAVCSGVQRWRPRDNPSSAESIGSGVTSRMRRVTSCAIAGVAWVSTTITASSPMKMPVFGSPSAV